MPEFYILDNNGNRKLTQFGSGASLPDPVTVPHGGTGLSSLTKGDILYASAANVISKLAIDDSGLRVLTNQGDATFTTPTWSDLINTGVIPKPTTRKSAWFTTFLGSGSVIWTTVLTGNSQFNDITGGWTRISGSSSGTAIGFRLNADWVWIEHLPRFDCVIRTGTDLTSQRIWICLNNAAALIGNSDDQHLLKGCGLRYSTSASDAGLVTWTADGTTQTIGSNVQSLSISTVYVVSMAVTSTTNLAITINGGTTVNVTIPAGVLSTALRPNIQITPLVASARFFDLGSAYGEAN